MRHGRSMIERVISHRMLKLMWLLPMMYEGESLFGRGVSSVY
jgi:hypothetical protein